MVLKNKFLKPTISYFLLLITSCTMKSSQGSETSESGIIPESYLLFQNFPNPFNPVTTIRFGLPKESKVNLSIYNILGEKLESIILGQKPAGYHKVTRDASNFASGIYFYRLQAGDFVQTRKIVYLKQNLFYSMQSNIKYLSLGSCYGAKTQTIVLSSMWS